MPSWSCCLGFALLFFCGEVHHQSVVFSKFHTDHDGSLRIKHSFDHDNAQTGEFARIKYNATKCARRKYLVLENAKNVYCVGNERIVCEFSSKEHQQLFLADAGQKKILMSHRKLPCFGTGEGLILQIKKAVAADDFKVEVQGSVIQPFELFEHLEAEVSTNMLFSHRRESKTGYPGAKMEPQSTSEEMSMRQADVDTEASIGPWKIPLPSDVLWQDPSAARMFCIDCGMHFHPVLKFKIRIENYRLEEFLILYESTTVLDLEPHVSFDARTSSQSMELYKDYLEQLLSQSRVTFYVGGVPVEISPGVRLGLFMFSAANVEANVGYKDTLIGAFKGGIEYSSTKGLQPIGSAHFHSAPKNYKLLLGKKCQLYSKPRVEPVKDISECSKLCNQYRGCKYFSYEASTGVCKLSRDCQIEKNTSSDELVFESSRWSFPPPNPELKGMISFGFMPEIFLKINRIGGPNLALCIAQTLQLFSYNIASQCSVSRLDTKVSYLVGGNIHLKVGEATVLKMEEYLQPIYSHTLPITAAFEICPKVKIPDVNFPLPWMSEPSNAPKSLDDAIERSNTMNLGFKNLTDIWNSSNDGTLKSVLYRIQGLSSQPSNSLSDRFSNFFGRFISWIKKKANIV